MLNILFIVVVNYIDYLILWVVRATIDDEIRVFLVPIRIGIGALVMVGAEGSSGNSELFFFGVLLGRVFLVVI